MAANMKVAGPNNEKASPLDDPGNPIYDFSILKPTNHIQEVIHALAGSVRWVLDLIAWLTDSLLTLPSTFPDASSLTDASKLSIPDLLSYLHSTNSVSLHLILSSPTRGFLTAICRRLTHIDVIARKAIAYTTSGFHDNNNNISQNQNHQPPISPALRAAYYQIVNLTTSSILRIKTFETLLSSLTTSIKAAYTSHNPSFSGSQAAEKARNLLELKMLFGGDIPEAFSPVIVEMFTTLLPTLQEEIDPTKLFFMDFGMLEADDDDRRQGGMGRGLERKRDKNFTMDCFKKEWLSNPKKTAVNHNGDKSNGNGSGNAGGSLNPQGQGGGVPRGRTGARWRRCARCAAVMEDLLSQRQALQWLVMQQRRCFCSGYWDTLAVGEIVA